MKRIINVSDKAHEIFDGIEANLDTLEIDGIKRRLECLIKGMRVESPIFDPGVFLYRARRVTPTFNKRAGIRKSDLVYPPKQLAKLQRLNRPGRQVFYCSLHKESVFYEVQGLRPGDELIVSFWKTNARMIVNNLGYTDFVFKQLGAKRALPLWIAPPQSNRAAVTLPRMTDEAIRAALSSDRNHKMREALSRQFMREVGPEETDRYKVTTAIGELHLGDITNLNSQFAGVLYPSAQMWANADNVALLPWFVDRHLDLKKAVHVRIDDRKGANFSITNLDASKEFDSDGQLVWLGRMPNWTIQPGQRARFTCTAGIDEDGDYQTGTDGKACHWLAADESSGEVIQPR